MAVWAVNKGYRNLSIEAAVASFVGPPGDCWLRAHRTACLCIWKLTPFFEFPFQQYLFSKKLLDRHNADWVIGYWGEGRARYKAVWVDDCCLCVILWFSSKSYSGKYWEMAAALWSPVVASSDLPLSLKATSSGCLKKQDVSMGPKLFIWI